MPKETLIAKSKTDVMRVYLVQEDDGTYRRRPYEVRVNSVSAGDPVYEYETEFGAKIAMRMFEKGSYRGKSPSGPWD